VSCPPIFLYADAVTFDLWHDATLPGTGTWGIDAEILDDVRVNWVRGNVITHSAANGSDTVYGYSYEDHDTEEAGWAAGYIYYGEYILVDEPGPTTVLETQVATSSDDAEEKNSGRMKLTSADLELQGDQMVGLRFTGLSILQGATIANAYVQFQADEVHAESTSLTIEGEDVDDATTFSSINENISSRPRTFASVSWSPVPWTTVGAAGSDQRTPNLATIVQEIVDRPGWSSDQSMVLIVTGSGRRVPESYNGGQNGAPRLHVEYATGGRNYLGFVTGASSSGLRTAAC